MPHGVLYRPEVPIRVIGSTGEVSLFILADTGADETLLPRSVGELVGAEIDEHRFGPCPGSVVKKWGSCWPKSLFALASRGTVHHWRAKVGLVDFANPDEETAVLGHVGFFDHFTGHFNTRRRRLTINPYR